MGESSVGVAPIPGGRSLPRFLRELILFPNQHPMELLYSTRPDAGTSLAFEVWLKPQARDWDLSKSYGWPREHGGPTLNSKTIGANGASTKYRKHIHRIESGEFT